MPGNSELHVLLPSTGHFAAHEILPVAGTAGSATGPQPTSKASWRQQFHNLRRAFSETENPFGRDAREPRRLAHYRLNVLKSLNGDHLVLDLFQQMGRRDTSPQRPLILTEREVAEFSRPAGPRAAFDPARHRLARAAHRLEHRHGPPRAFERRHPPFMCDTLLPRLCATGRFGWVSGIDGDNEEVHPLSWDGELWKFQLEVERLTGHDDLQARLGGHFLRGKQKRDLSDALILLHEGIVVFHDTVSPLEVGEHFPWISLLRRDHEIEVPESEIDAMLEDFWSMPVLPPLKMPRQWQLDEVDVDPQPGVSFIGLPTEENSTPQLRGEVSFNYDGIEIHAERDFGSRSPHHLVDRPHGRLVVRSREKEQALIGELYDLGLDVAETRKVAFQVPRAHFAEKVRLLLERGWEVRAEGQKLRRPTAEGITLSGFEQRRLVRARRRDRVRRHPHLAARPAGGDPPRRPFRAPRRRHPRPAARGMARSATPGSPRPRPPTSTTPTRCVSCPRRPSCSTACWPPKASTSTATSRRSASRCRPSSRSSRPRSRAASAASCGPTSAKAWAGSSSSRTPASAAAWPTTWASAKPSRCSPCCRCGAPGRSPSGNASPR